MAQPQATRLEYLGAVEVKEGVEYTASSFASTFSDATTFMMKSKGKITKGVRQPVLVGIDNTPMFPVEYNETTAFDADRTPPLKYKFNQDCIILVAKELDITP